MNLLQTLFLLSADAEDFLRILYRQSKIKASVNLNVIAAVMDISSHYANDVARQLHELGLLNYEKYGCVSLTAKGIAYGKSLLQKT